MVAIHNRKLSDKDIFPGVLWTDADWHRMRDLFSTTLPADISHPERYSMLSKMMIDYQSRQPSLRERQRIMALIYPRPPRRVRACLNQDEIEYLKIRLLGANDDTGQAILAKLEFALSHISSGNDAG